MFDPAQTFNDDYLWFYEPMLTEEHNRAEAAEIVDTLGLTAGASILDAPCGYGRIANLLAASLIWFEYDSVEAKGLDEAVFSGYLHGLRDSGWR